MSHVPYWVMGLLGFPIYGLNCLAEKVVVQTDEAMDFISNNTDHAREEFHFPRKHLPASAERL